MGPEKVRVKSKDHQKENCVQWVRLAKIPKKGKAPVSKKTGPVKLPANRGFPSPANMTVANKNANT